MLTSRLNAVKPKKGQHPKMGENALIRKHQGTCTIDDEVLTCPTMSACSRARQRPAVIGYSSSVQLCKLRYPAAICQKKAAVNVQSGKRRLHCEAAIVRQ